MIEVGKLYEIDGPHIKYDSTQFSFVYTPHTNTTTVITNSYVGTAQVGSTIWSPTTQTCGVYHGIYINDKFFTNGTICMVVQTYKIGIQQFASILVDDSLYAIAVEHIKELSC